MVILRQSTSSPGTFFVTRVLMQKIILFSVSFTDICNQTSRVVPNFCRYGLSLNARFISTKRCVYLDETSHLPRINIAFTSTKHRVYLD